MKRRPALGAALAALTALVVASAGGADTTSTQAITASVTSSITMTTTPTVTIPSWNLAVSGANTLSGGQIVVASNVPYKVTVQSDVAKMTQWTGSAYVTPSPKVLTSALSVLTALASGSGVPIASLAVGSTAASIATGAGLTTDTYDVTVSQPTVLTDAPGTYHIVLTYTATAQP